MTVDCKLWDPTRPPVGGMPLFDPASGQLPNAMRVRIGKTLGNVIPSAFVGGDTVVSVQAVATSTQPVAAFTVGSRLLRLEKGGLLSKILASVGATPQQLDVLDAAGLATVNITPSGLLDALGLPLSVATGVGTPAQLAAVSNLTLGQLLNATLTVINKAGTAAADITLLNNAIKTVLQVMPLNLPVKLFGDGGVLDLQVVGGSVTSALQANVNALNILQTALVIANGQNLIDLGLNVPLLGVQSKVRIVEPPTIAVGGVGATATSAGIRVYLRINTSNIPVLGPLLGTTLGTWVDLPVIIDVAQSTGTLAKLCQAPLTSTQATINVTSSLDNVCLGRFPGMTSDSDTSPANFLALTNACQPASFNTIQRYKVLNVLGILPLTSKVTLPVFNSAAPVPVTLTAPPSPNSTATVNATSLDLTKLASNLADALIGGILGDLFNTGTPLTEQQRTDLATKLVGGGGSNPQVRIGSRQQHAVVHGRHESARAAHEHGRVDRGAGARCSWWAIF